MASTAADVLDFLDSHACGKYALEPALYQSRLMLGYKCNKCGEEVISPLSSFKARRYSVAKNKGMVKMFEYFRSLNSLLEYYTSGYLKVWDKKEIHWKVV